nr:DUF3189 family protein [Thermosyntropha sp.]
MYFDYGGSHSSVLAANIHAGKLEKGKVPSKEDMMKLPLFDKTTPDDFGRIYYVGSDQKGNEIYILGTQNSNFEPALRSLTALMELDKEFVLVCTMSYVNVVLRLGGFLSRRMSCPLLGRPFVIWGSKLAFPHLEKLTEIVKLESL